VGQRRSRKIGASYAAKDTNSNRVTWLLILPLLDFSSIKYSSITFRAHTDEMRHQVILLSCQRSANWFIKWRGRQIRWSSHIWRFHQLLCKSTYNSEIVVINGDSLKTYHMRSIRGKMLQELSHWHNSKFTEDINEMVFIQLRLAQIPIILEPKV
jgi:hypothetical protein